MAGAADELVVCARDARVWLATRAAPLWSSVGVHADGMFAERIDGQGLPTDETRRTRVQARQIYAFCELGRLGLCDSWRGIVEPALAILLERGAREDGFFVHRFDAEGRVADDRADLYDSAFLLFAFGHAARALGRDDLIERAERLMRAIEDQWSHTRGGFREGEIIGPPRRQNPHMHLLEATMLLWQVTGTPVWRARAGRLAALGVTSLIDPASGALTEYFLDDWRRAFAPEGEIVEPGHCLEWASLLEGWARSGGAADPAVADRLIGFARGFGLGEGGAVAINAVNRTGEIIDASARLWPQAERLRAAVLRWRRTADAAEAAEAVTAWRGLARYLDGPVPGAWRDRLGADGRWIDEPAPASSFYHIVCALSALLETVSCSAGHD